MRSTTLAGVAAAAVIMTAVPSEAAWNGYFNKVVEFSFFAPGELKTERGTYSGTLAGQRGATVFQSEEDQIQYKVIVVDFSDRPNEEAALLAEAAAAFLGIAYQRHLERPLSDAKVPEMPEFQGLLRVLAPGR